MMRKCNIQFERNEHEHENVNNVYRQKYKKNSSLKRILVSNTPSEYAQVYE